MYSELLNLVADESSLQFSDDDLNPEIGSKQRGLHMNERSIRYGEDLDVSDITVFLSFPLDSSRTVGLSSVYSTGNYDIGSGQKLISLEL